MLGSGGVIGYSVSRDGAPHKGNEVGKRVKNESFVDRLQNSGRYGSLVERQDSVSNTEESKFKYSGDIAYK